MMESDSRLLLGGDYHQKAGGGGGIPMNLALVGRGMHGGHRGPGSVASGGGGGGPPGEGSSSDGQEEINVEDDGPVLHQAGTDSAALPSHLRPDDGGCSSSDDSRKVRIRDSTLSASAYNQYNETLNSSL